MDHRENIIDNAVSIDHAEGMCLCGTDHTDHTLGRVMSVTVVTVTQSSPLTCPGLGGLMATDPRISSARASNWSAPTPSGSSQSVLSSSPLLSPSSNHPAPSPSNKGGVA